MTTFFDKVVMFYAAGVQGVYMIRNDFHGWNKVRFSQSCSVKRF